MFFRKHYINSIVEESEKKSIVYMKKINELIENGDIIHDDKLNKWCTRKEYTKNNCF